jgi:hypothetical protein
MGPIIGVDDVERRKILSLPGLEHRPLAHLARSHIMRNLKHIMYVKLTAFLPNVIILVSLT